MSLREVKHRIVAKCQHCHTLNETNAWMSAVQLSAAKRGLRGWCYRCKGPRQFPKSGLKLSGEAV